VDSVFFSETFFTNAMILQLFVIIIRALRRDKKAKPAVPPKAITPQPGTASVDALREARTRMLAQASEQSMPPASVATPGNRPPQRRETTLQLDASQFQPLPADQVRSQAMSTQFTGFFEFGRRDRIPSAADPRTKLIDQALVGQGLIKPEELVRIHEIGQKMEELRPQIVGAHVLAARAVQADREAKKRIKAEKKAAAEQRRREHAARIAANKLTDIIHLGRGVSAGLADRRSNVEKLQSRNLPQLATPADVANAMGIGIPKLRWLAYHAEASTVTHYVQFMVAKKSGGERTLSAPHQKMAAAQRWIFENILQKLPAHDSAHGFVTDRSILTNATPHVGKAVVVNCDLTDFFPSITVHRVIGLFRQIGYSPAVATILALLATDCPRRKVLYNGKPWHVATGPRGLPQGACTSPAISNLIARRMDSRLNGIAKKLNWTYTRYADDLTFSSRDPTDKTAYLLARIRHITSDEGFLVNERKTRILKQAARQSVTGVVVNTQTSTSRKTRRQLRAILHNAGKTNLNAQNRGRRKDFMGWLNGMIGFVAMVNPRQAIKLRQQMARYI
jgi:RNA-directed DNA polymerase